MFFTVFYSFVVIRRNQNSERCYAHPGFYNKATR